MKEKLAQTIRLVVACLVEKENKPTTTTDIFNTFQGEVAMQDIHYALRVMLQNRHASRIKQATYVLTDSTRPVESYTKIGKKKARKPRQLELIQEPKPFVTLEQKIKEWDEEEKKVDFQTLCEKLQNALAKSYVDCDLLEATVAEQRTIIKYLESKVRETPTV